MIMKSNPNKSAMWGRIFLTLCLLILTATLAFAGTNGKISKELLANKSSDKIDVIVQFNQVPTTFHHKKISDRGGKLKRELGHFKGGAYTISAAKLAELANDPSVVFISPDRKLKGASTSGAGIDYHTDTINASAAVNLGLDGTGVGIAVIDSGVNSVSDLNGNNLVYSQDFTGLGSTADQYGHGTHVSGIIAGSGANSSLSGDFYSFKGIAPNANIVNLRVLDQNGEGTDSEVIAAIQAAIQLKSTYNIGVINLSVGRPVYESYKLDPLCQAVEQAWQAGIVVVTAAGNYGRDNLAGTNGYGTITAPGNDPYVITVGAMNSEGTADRTDDVPASYSSKGPSIFDQVVKPDLVAPGNAIISLYTPGDTLDTLTPGNEVPFSVFQTNGTSTSSSYFVLSGTSMAAPMVSGAAALMLQQNPALTPDQIKARLMKTAFKGFQKSSIATDATTGTTYNEQADIFTVGAGELDIQAALANTDLAPATSGSAVSPTAAINANGDVILVTGASVLGSSGDEMVLWGSSAVWGDEMVLWGSNAATDDMVLWGSSSLADDMVLWGSSLAADDMVLWGSSQATDDMVLWGSGLSEDDMVLWGSSTPWSIRDK